MDPNLRHVWTRVIEAGDLEEHLRAVGQAEANAALVAEMLAGSPEAGRILIAGAGTGQMFDYVDPAFLAGREVVFTDINPSYLARLEQRVAGSGLRYRVAVDDIEQTGLQEQFDAVVAVLLLEHVEWGKALRTMVGWMPRSIHLIIQRNPPSVHSSITPGRPLKGSMAEFARLAHPVMLDEAVLVRELEVLGYALAAKRERAVADSKAMVAFSFVCS